MLLLKRFHNHTPSKQQLAINTKIYFHTICLLHWPQLLNYPRVDIKHIVTDLVYVNNWNVIRQLFALHSYASNNEPQSLFIFTKSRESGTVLAGRCGAVRGYAMRCGAARLRKLHCVILEGAALRGFARPCFVIEQEIQISLVTVWELFCFVKFWITLKLWNMYG